jgi:2-keto-4-pentenoate hydratase
MSTGLDDVRIAKGMRAQLALRKRRFEEGAKQAGWKVGLGAPAVMAKLGLAMPLVGFVLDRAVLPVNAAISIAGWQKPVAEAEIAAIMGRDLPEEADLQAVRSAIAALAPAIELADMDFPMDDVEAVLAGDIFQRHVVLGPPDEMRAGARLDGLTGRLRRSGEDVAVPANLEENTGEVVRIVQHVARVAAALGDGLRAGQFIICGSVTPPMFLQPDETAIEWTLDPIGRAAVRFE